MTLQQFLQQLNDNPTTIDFEQTMAVINDHYDYAPTRFLNGDVVNEAGTNEGSCKIFAFAQLNQLSDEATLNCFGRFYREDVLQNPEGSDHANIRTFIQRGFAGLNFDAPALTPRA